MAKWTCLVGLNQTTVENCGEMDVFDWAEPEYGGLSTTGIVLCSTK